MGTGQHSYYENVAAVGEQLSALKSRNLTFHSIDEHNEELVVQNLRREPHSSVMVRRFRKRKSCCHKIAIPQAGIAAPTLTVMQGFAAKKKIAQCISFPIPAHCVYTPYSSIPRIPNSSANRTRVRWLEAEHYNHYTMQFATMQ